ncbi:tol-pal system-associated acyl-CoA thioesterase [Shewanella surugensis]|uniref:Tol-pal system-associated acyl-CoA thioesterase n=2 Tax=Shewanella surugensis TaxID=212020 RepID=A0ABT0LFZ3_9GAMM|nr:tol-pal system-associated acyl-CoA thioesterase [Shewanella surugensis]
MFSWPIFIYYEDTDAGGVVYHANYLKFFERARTQWLNALGISQTDLLAGDRAFAVKHAELDFCKPARLEQNLIVETKVNKVKRASLLFEQRIIDEDGVVYCKGMILVACISLSQMKPKAIPKHIIKEFSCGC